MDKHAATSKDLIAEAIDPYIGKVLASRYSIERLLGSGGWGNVYLAEHLTLSNKVAIKILHSHLAKDEDRQKRLEQEAQVLSKLDSHYIIKTIDYGLIPAPYIVMEYFEGNSLDEILKIENFDEGTAIEIIEQICLGLQAAHTAGLVHRDLKPSNVLIANHSGKRKAKLLDFGIAKIAVSDSQASKLTATGEILGSPPYMSPEQWTARPTDQRSDIYSLGCLMYEVLSGKVIFEGANSFEYLNLHLTEEPKTFKEVAPERKVSPELEAIVRNCLQKEPQDRYDSTGEILDDLQKVREGKQVRKRVAQKKLAAKTSKISANRILIAITAGVIVFAVGLYLLRAPIAGAYCENLNQQAEHLSRSKPKEAIAIYQQSLAFGQFLPKKDPRRLETMDQLGELFSKSGSKAESLVIKKLYKDEVGDIQPPEWRELTDRAQKALVRNKFGEAKGLTESALAMAEKLAGKNSIVYARSLDNLGQVYRESGRGKDAISIQEESLRIAESLMESNDRITSLMLNNLGVCYKAAGRTREAQEAFERSVERANKLSAPEIGLISQYSNLGSLYMDQKEYAKSLDAFRRAEELNTQLGGPGAVPLKTRIGNVYLRMQRYDDAIKEYEEAIRLRELSGKAIDTKANHDYYNLALCYERKGELEKAASFYKMCMETYALSGIKPDSYYPMFQKSYDRVNALIAKRGQRVAADGK